MRKPIAAVTGANGYVGSVICAGLTSAGFTTRRLVRRPQQQDRNDFSYDIVAGCGDGALEGVDVLIHCAYDLSITSRVDVWRTNVIGTRSLLDLAQSQGIRRTILISSMSAHSGTRQIYGRAKLASETDAFARGMCVVRPGLVYGPGWGGMTGTLRKLVSLPAIPLIGRSTHQFTVHESDLQSAITALSLADAIPSHPLGLAHPDPVLFKELLRSIAEANSNGHPRFVPIPWQPLYLALRMAELTPAKLPIRADSLLGLVRSAPSVPGLDDLLRYGISFRPFHIP